MEWEEGEPKEAGYYIAAIRTKDKEEHYYVKELWFNPESIDKWYDTMFFGSTRAVPVKLKVRYYMKMPHSPGLGPAGQTARGNRR